MDHAAGVCSSPKRAIFEISSCFPAVEHGACLVEKEPFQEFDNKGPHSCRPVLLVQHVFLGYREGFEKLYMGNAITCGQGSSQKDCMIVIVCEVTLNSSMILGVYFTSC